METFGMYVVRRTSGKELPNALVGIGSFEGVVEFGRDVAIEYVRDDRQRIVWNWVSSDHVAFSSSRQEKGITDIDLQRSKVGFKHGSAWSKENRRWSEEYCTFETKTSCGNIAIAARYVNDPIAALQRRNENCSMKLRSLSRTFVFQIWSYRSFRFSSGLWNGCKFWWNAFRRFSNMDRLWHAIANLFCK